MELPLVYHHHCHLVLHQFSVLHEDCSIVSELCSSLARQQSHLQPTQLYGFHVEVQHLELKHDHNLQVNIVWQNPRLKDWHKFMHIDTQPSSNLVFKVRVILLKVCTRPFSQNFRRGHHLFLNCNFPRSQVLWLH